ncbi:MAG: TauD/TfdA family dioxygenase [Xanthomonadales bacterium]|nr:TauD/TfdA family dioxygenase [Xanthomonadales bacterium]
MKDISFQIDPVTPRVVARLERGEIVLPALWLRERCQDPEHVDQTTRQRLFDPHRLPEDLALTAAERLESGRVRLGFSDGYRGEYDLESLAEEFRARDGLPAPRPWGASLDRAEVTLDWRALSEDAALHQALGAFLRRGFLILQHVPTDPARILEVADRFGHVRDTNFGKVFEVYSRPGSNDLAYATVALGPHTDNPYRRPAPGIQLLHCLVNETRGGLSTLTDSLAVGRVLAREDPDAFERLATTPVRFRFVDPDEELIEHRCIIRRDAAGEMVGVHYSPRLDGLPLLDDTGVRAFHRARRRLAELLADPRFELRFPLRQGELVMFDNSRVLHGRTAFDATEGRRHLQGCYIDLDEPRSRYRTLSRRLRAAYGETCWTPLPSGR